jgi:hypothetical protein
MTKEQMQTGIHNAVRHVAKLPKDMPKERVAGMLQRVALGVATLALGMTGLKAGWNEWLVVGIFFIGGNLISNQLLTGAAEKAVSPITAIFRAIRGNGG